MVFQILTGQKMPSIHQLGEHVDRAHQLAGTIYYFALITYDLVIFS